MHNIDKCFHIQNDKILPLHYCLVKTKWLFFFVVTKILKLYWTEHCRDCSSWLQGHEVCILGQRKFSQCTKNLPLFSFFMLFYLHKKGSIFKEMLCLLKKQHTIESVKGNVRVQQKGRKCPIPALRQSPCLRKSDRWASAPQPQLGKAIAISTKSGYWKSNTQQNE